MGFELYSNVGRACVGAAGLSPEFAELVWAQGASGVRGETSLDAFEYRQQALGASAGRADEKVRSDLAAAAFSDAIAIYLLSLCLDRDYDELPEREYTFLA